MEKPLKVENKPKIKEKKSWQSNQSQLLDLSDALLVVLPTIVVTAESKTLLLRH